VSFYLPVSFVFVAPQFEKVRQAWTVVVVQDDGGLSVVPVEPLGLWFDVVCVSPLLSSIVRLTCAWWPVDPYASAVFCGDSGSGTDLVKVDGLDYFVIVLKVNKSLLKCLLWPVFKDLHVLSCSIASLVLACWLNSEGEWSVEASRVFVTVFSNSIVLFNYYKVGVFAVLL